MSNYPTLSKLVSIMEEHAPGAGGGHYEFKWPRNASTLERIASRFDQNQLEIIATGWDEDDDQASEKLEKANPELKRVTAFLNAVFEGDFSNRYFDTKF